MTISSQQETTAPLVTAFAEDRVIRWLYPEPGRYLEWFPRLVEVMGAPASGRSTADLDPGGAAAAVWVEPEAELDETAIGTLVAESVAPARRPDVYAFLEQMDQHHPRTPTWYLPFIGVDPSRQGEGLGSELLARGIARADADGLPAYLEASSPRNRALYERHGFEANGEIQVADSPPMWPMLRRPR